MNKACWTLRRMILDFHDPVYFKELREKYIEYKLMDFLDEDEYSFDFKEKEIVVNSFDTFNYVLQIFGDHEAILFDDSIATIYFQKFSIDVRVDIKNYIMNIVRGFCWRFGIGCEYDEFLDEIVIETTQTRHENTTLVQSLMDFIIEMDITILENGTEIVLYTEGDVTITIYSSIIDDFINEDLIL